MRPGDSLQRCIEDIVKEAAAKAAETAAEVASQQLVATLKRELDVIKRLACMVSDYPDPGVASRRLLRAAEVKSMCSISNATLYKGINEGTFPKPIKISDRSVRWRLTDIDSWLEACERRQ